MKNIIIITIILLGLNSNILKNEELNEKIDNIEIYENNDTNNLNLNYLYENYINEDYIDDVPFDTYEIYKNNIKGVN